MIVCLGEAIVDLICEQEAASLAEADSFTPHFGGALANVAVACRRAGSECALAGGVGDDAWGRWLDEALVREDIDVRWHSLVPGVATPIAFVTFDGSGEPRFQIYGEGIVAGVRSLAGREVEMIDAASALVFGSNTLVGEPERALTLEARRLARRREIPVLFDPNIRPHRWQDLDSAIQLCCEMCDGAFVVRANREEAKMLTGESDPAGAAAALVSLGSRLAVVTRGAEGAVMRGAAEDEAPGVPVEVVSTMGAGDAFMGTLAAGLERLGWDAGRAGEALPAAVEASSAACRTWGAWD
jgi:sugar/nucleoside kinase (ribokinase family)